MKLSDLKGLFKKSEASIISIENPYGDYYLVKMKPESGKTWIAGEHGIFKFPNHPVDGKKWRAFSLASIPEEGYVMIGTRTGEMVSDYKKKLLAMEVGDKVAITGPFGWFKVQDEHTPIIMVAGGVGITPFRALLKQLEKDPNRPIELIYSASDYYLFEEEIQEIVLNNKAISLCKTKTHQETNDAVNRMVEQYKDNGYYYISGSWSFIKAIKGQIKGAGVKNKKIIYDPFLGYKKIVKKS